MLKRIGYKVVYLGNSLVDHLRVGIMFTIYKINVPPPHPTNHEKLERRQAPP